MENLEIRAKAKDRGVKLWEVAEAMGISEGVFCRRMRRELPQEQKRLVLQAIEQAAAKKQEASA